MGDEGGDKSGEKDLTPKDNQCEFNDTAPPEDDDPINEREKASDDNVAHLIVLQTKAKSKLKAKTTTTKKHKLEGDTEDAEPSPKKSKTSTSKPPAIVKPAGGRLQHKCKAPKPFEPDAVHVTGPAPRAKPGWEMVPIGSQ